MDDYSNDNEKTRVSVPKKLIKEYLLPIEDITDYSVVLINDMWADVIVEEDGSLSTETNDSSLIGYLKKNQVSDYIFINEKDFILRTITKKDCSLLNKWNNDTSVMKRHGFPCGYQTTLKDTHKFIVECISLKSHVFIIEKNNVPIGVTSYNIQNKEAIIHLVIHDLKYINQELKINLTKFIMSYLEKLFLIKSFIVEIHELDSFNKKIFEELGFKPTEKITWRSFPDLEQNSYIYKKTANYLN